MVHELKILPEYFSAVVDRRKTFEIRKNDRGYQVGDTLVLKEYDGIFTGREQSVQVTYMTDYAQTDGYTVMSIELT